MDTKYPKEWKNLFAVIAGLLALASMVGLTPDAWARLPLAIQVIIAIAVAVIVVVYVASDRWLKIRRAEAQADASFGEALREAVGEVEPPKVEALVGAVKRGADGRFAKRE